jgi:hypothetical protein
MTMIVLIYVLVRYGQVLVPEQSKTLALIGLILTILYVAVGWPQAPFPRA